MAAREGHAPLARRAAIYGVVGLAAIAGVAIWSGAGPQRGTGAAGDAPDAAAVGSVAAAAPQAAVPAGAGLPPSLAGSSAPSLPLDTGGHLAKSRAVRDFFDYCLTARSDLSAAALDAFVVREIAAQLDGTVAQVEALDVWHRYRAYLDALATLRDAGAVDKSDLAALQLALDQRASIAYRTLGDWSQPFFGVEQWRQRYDLARLKITQDRSLTDAQKAERLAALEQQMPADERAAQQRVDRQRAAIDQIAQLQKSGATPDAMRAQLTQTLGPEAAARVAQMQQDDASWQSRYADYATQRAQIESAGLSPQDRDAQIAALRQRVFTKPGEAVRAASLDRGAGSAH
ncbi:lipase secretion chaperone [Burkholderia cenocepacia]|uniref:lipase secretion chaperone n=1 Tax=Burkholderia cenocepacia TaxID=95486 RepID=UPI000F568807|nr:lipase secretion chaperone [Burkholderia cenocepacia]RQV05145.1 lipase secretion chaperone [Burkholderia cenocepacia]